MAPEISVFGITTPLYDIKELIPQVVFSFRKFEETRSKLIAIYGNETRYVVHFINDLPDPSALEPWKTAQLRNFGLFVCRAAIMLRAQHRVAFICGGGKNRAPSLAWCACILAGIDPVGIPKPEDEKMHVLLDCARDVHKTVDESIKAMDEEKHELSENIIEDVCEAFGNLGSVPAQERRVSKRARNA